MKVVRHKPACAGNGAWIIEDADAGRPEDAPLPGAGEFEPPP